MKIANPVDAVVNFFSPVAGLKRTQARAAQAAIRNYDIADQGRRNSGWFRPFTDGKTEVSKAEKVAAASAQELGRNNTHGGRIKRVWANNIVAGGISGDIMGSESQSQVDTMQEVWDEWCNSTGCDFEEHYNFYGLEYLWAMTMVESGGVLIRKHVNPTLKFPLQLQTFEQSQLDKLKQGDNISDGIEYNNMGQLKGYWVITNPDEPGKSTFYKKHEIIHIFRKDRVGQHLGITWYTNVATTLRDYDTYKDAKLMQQQIAALLALFIRDIDGGMGVGSGKGTNDIPDELEPGMIANIKSTSEPFVVTPPKADNASQFDVSLKQDMSVGSGITYEQFTGDYSRVNWASGRMGRTEFYLELDFVQRLIMQPAMDKVFNWFSTIYSIKTGFGGVKVDWTFPPRAAVNPKEELDVIITKIRNGLLSPTKGAKILGERLEKIIAQWEKDKELFGNMPFDIDPSLFANTGNQLDSNDAASSNNNTGDPNVQE